MDPNGSNQTRLTTHSAGDLSPAISPNGGEIVFESTGFGNQEILVLDSDGSNLRRLTTTTAFEFCAAWSPDGAEIAFCRASGNACTIHVISANATNERQLTVGSHCDAIPDWSIDGSTILFHSDRNGHNEIYVVNADGTDPRPITDSPGDKIGPKWSPDGTRIVYALTDFSSHRAGIHVMNGDGTSDIALTDGSWNDEAPDWSVDGDRIVFNSNRNSVSEIYSIDLEGNDLLRLTWDQGDSRGPNWGAVPVPSGVNEPTEANTGQGLELHFTNPIRAGMPIRFNLDREAGASIQVFDSHGRCVRTLLRRYLGAGAHASLWDGRDDAGRMLPSALYHCRLVSGATSRTAALVHLK